MQLLRRVFFYLFVAIYLVFCPMTIFYALGYLFRPGEAQGIVKTGLIYLSTVPTGASVYLENKRYVKKTPTILRDLLPGDYEVKLLFKHRKPWSQTVPVEIGKATVLERILLLPMEWRETVFSANSYDNIIPIPGMGYFLVTNGDLLRRQNYFNWQIEHGWPFFKEGAPLGDWDVLSYYIRMESPSFLVRAGSKGEEKFLWCAPGGDEILVEDITRLFSERPSKVSWDPGESDLLFAYQSGYLNRLDIRSQAVSPKFLEDVRGFGLYRKKLYFLSGSLFGRIDLHGKNQEVLVDDPRFLRTLFGEKGFFEIHVLSDDLIVFLGERGELLANRLPYRVIEEGVLGFEWRPNLEHLLVWKKEKVGILDFSEQEQSKGVFEKGPEVQWIFKKGREIEQAFWVYEGSHVLFRDEDEIFLMELETYGKPTLDSFLKVKEKSSVFYAEDSGRLYYLDRSTGQLSSLEILPRKEILLLPFPERKEEKKKAKIGEL